MERLTDEEFKMIKNWVFAYYEYESAPSDRARNLLRKLDPNRTRENDLAASPPEKSVLDPLAVAQENIVILQSDFEVLSAKLYLLLDILNQKSILPTPVINMIREEGECD